MCPSITEVGSEDDDDDDLSDDDEEEEEEEEEQEDGGIIQQQNQASAPGVAAAGAAVAVAPKSGKLAKNQLAAVVPQLPAHNKGCGRGRKAAPAPQDDADQNVEQEQADIKQQQKVQQASSKSKKESTTLQDGMQQQPKQQPGSAKAVSGSGKARGQRGDSGKGVVLINQNGNDHLAQPARKDVAGRQQSGKRKADAAGGRAKAAAADVDKQANKKRRSGKGMCDLKQHVGAASVGWLTVCHVETKQTCMARRKCVWWHGSEGYTKYTCMSYHPADGSRQTPPSQLA